MADGFFNTLKGGVSMKRDERPEPTWATLRKRMVEQQIRGRGVRDTRVLDTMARLPRERFLPKSVRASAYEDRALPIGHDQTISQPYITAYMTEQLVIGSSARVLEIGTGSGYQTAILAMMGGHVYSIERIAELQAMACANLSSLELNNATLSTGDGSLGLADCAPYDRILVAASAPSIPGALVDQLVDGGVLVIPVGDRTEQTLIRIVRQGPRTIEEPTLSCKFVKLIGKGGWHADD